MTLPNWSDRGCLVHNPVLSDVPSTVQTELDDLQHVQYIWHCASSRMSLPDCCGMDNVTIRGSLIVINEADWWQLQHRTRKSIESRQWNRYTEWKEKRTAVSENTGKKKYNKRVTWHTKNATQMSNCLLSSLAVRASPGSLPIHYFWG
jgi:hypothetical protein